MGILAAHPGQVTGQPEFPAVTEGSDIIEGSVTGEFRRVLPGLPGTIASAVSQYRGLAKETVSAAAAAGAKILELMIEEAHCIGQGNAVTDQVPPIELEPLHNRIGHVGDIESQGPVKLADLQVVIIGVEERDTGLAAPIGIRETPTGFEARRFLIGELKGNGVVRSGIEATGFESCGRGSEQHHLIVGAIFQSHQWRKRGLIA